MKVEEIKSKIKNNIHICSKCIQELIWKDSYCPECGNDKFYPYYDFQGSELKK